MMEAIPRDYGQGQFDAFCKKVLKNEARAWGRYFFWCIDVWLQLLPLAYRPQAALSSSTRSVFSQVKSASSRPKWP